MDMARDGWLPWSDVRLDGGVPLCLCESLINSIFMFWRLRLGEEDRAGIFVEMGYFAQMLETVV